METKRLNRKRVRREDAIVNYCDGKVVLHLGCADAPNTRQGLLKNMLLHQRISDVAKKVYGIDISEDGIRTLSEYGFENVICADLEELAENPFGVIFDVVVAGELIEHIGNVGKSLENIKHFMDANSVCIITVPNAFSIRRFIRAVIGKEFIHEGHLYYYSVATITHICQQYGYEVMEYAFCIGGNRNIIRRVLFYPLELFVKYIAPYLADGIFFKIRISETKKNV